MLKLLDPCLGELASPGCGALWLLKRVNCEEDPKVLTFDTWGALDEASQKSYTF